MLMSVFAEELRAGDGRGGAGITSVEEGGVGEDVVGVKVDVGWVLDEEVEEVG